MKRGWKLALLTVALVGLQTLEPATETNTAAKVAYMVAGIPMAWMWGWCAGHYIGVWLCMAAEWIISKGKG